MVGFVDSFLVGGEGGDASGICRLSAATLFHLGISQASLALRSTFTTPNDGVEVGSRSGFTVGVIVEVGQVEEHTAVHSPDAGHELTDFSLELHGVDVNQRSRTPINKSNAVSNDIVGTSVAGWRCCLNGIT